MKILFVRINDKIGDTVIETFFYRELKRLFPSSHLTVMCCGNKAILQEISSIDELIFLPPNGMSKIITAFAKIPQLNKQKYDLLISFTPHWRMRFFNFFVRASRKEYFDLIPNTHVSQAYRRVLERLGARDINSMYELPVPASARQAVGAFLRQHQLTDKPFLLFNPLGGTESRTLSVSRVQEIIQHLPKQPIVLLDIYHRYRVRFENTVCFTDNDIWQTIALIEKSAYVLTVDTGISHIAQVFDKPMTVLFSLKNYENEPAKDISLLTTWGPCTKHVQKLYADESVNQIPVADITSRTCENWDFEK